MDDFIYSLIINVAIYGAIGYVIGRILKRWIPNLKPSIVSIGCLSIVLVLSLLLGIGAWSAARSEKPFTLTSKELTAFDFHDSRKDISVGANLYVLSRFQDDVFEGKDAFRAKSHGDLVVVELMLDNAAERSLEITEDDIDLRFDGRRIGASVIDYEAAQDHLRSFKDVVAGTGGTFAALPWEVTCCFPLSLNLAPRDWVWVENRMRLICDNAFTFGLIEPFEVRHGFIYFEAGKTEVEWNDFLSRNQHRWGFEFAIRDDRDQVTDYSFDFER